MFVSLLHNMLENRSSLVGSCIPLLGNDRQHPLLNTGGWGFFGTKLAKHDPIFPGSENCILELAVPGQVGRSVHLPRGFFPPVLFPVISSPQPCGEWQAQGHHQHEWVRNRGSVPRSADGPIMAAKFWVDNELHGPLCFSLLQMISDDSCESGVIEVPVKSILLLFFADILGLLCFPPRRMSAVCFEQKSIQPQNPSYSMICSEWPFPKQPYSRRRWE